ncbi:MAG: helix-turn-helix domain-containing protein [Bryobacteraceae bacterium]|jgi:excisionase family DNA binding protein
MSPTTDLSSWLPKTVAAARLGISERTLDRLVAGGKGPACTRRQRKGKRPEVVFDPSEVEAIASAVTAVVVSESSIEERAAELRPSNGVPASDVLALVRQLVSVTPPPAPEAASVSAKLFLTLPEAAAYTGLTKGLLRRMVAEGLLAARKDRGWKIRRVALESIDNDPSSDIATGDNTVQKAFQRKQGGER